ncbi:NUDIX domain-containing protein [Gordonia sp. ABSL11-1]|uniref:NUDIX hydrolase n=1 Tax=Gordonia sp. ABSL11-1 TaxID=3053924 RepID=UPI002572FC07|nr:NUDIX domain-containing protein [Gordonia sp. ABSL11-1]MDL9944067.1 NUDIX domain-containing protein [Gordonia sp. ABSL11-1]
MATSESPAPAPLRDAATVVLVRDTASGIEVFLQRRVKQMAFAGGMTVFPGGGVDPRDAEVDLGWTGPDAQWWADAFGTDADTAKALVCAAVRETFEECGVLLATGSDGSSPEPQTFAAQRTQLVDKSLSLADFFGAQQLTLRADLLRPFAHWITPVNEKRRYDTRFFVAALPDGQDPDDQTSEAEVARWIGAQDALDAWAAGLHFLLPPTWAQLTAIAEYDSVADLLAATHEIEPIQPSITPGAGLSGLSFAGSDRYFATLGEQKAPDITL